MKKQKEQRSFHGLRAVLLAAALTLIAAGLWNGGAFDMLVKAITVCTECIGLG